MHLTELNSRMGWLRETKYHVCGMCAQNACALSWVVLDGELENKN